MALPFRTGATYEARPNLNLKIAYYHEDQNSYHGAPGSDFNAGRCSNASLAQCSGQLDALSFLMDYKYSNHMDVYAGIVWSQVSNDLASGFLRSTDRSDGRAPVSLLKRHALDP
jgi:predicted porin